MKTIKIVVTQILSVPDKWTIETEPDGEFKCVKVGKKYYDAGIMWLEHKESSAAGPEAGAETGGNYWMESNEFMEEIYDRMVSEDAKYKVLP